jgi:hypothetical protein
MLEERMMNWRETNLDEYQWEDYSKLIDEVAYC